MNTLQTKEQRLARRRVARQRRGEADRVLEAARQRRHRERRLAAGVPLRTPAERERDTAAAARRRQRSSPDAGSAAALA